MLNDYMLTTRNNINKIKKTKQNFHLQLYVREILDQLYVHLNVVFDLKKYKYQKSIELKYLKKPLACRIHIIII